METLFTVDGKAYSVGVESLERTADLPDGKNFGDLVSGRKQRDLKGTYYSYALRLSADGMSKQGYDALYEVLTAPVDSHMVKMPFGQGALTFEAYITTVQDALELADEDEGNQWGGLTVQFDALEPQRVPG